jgi:hypothetical protein
LALISWAIGGFKDMSTSRMAKAVIELTNGSILTGDVTVGPSGRLESVLYQPVEFLEFHPEDGSNTKFIAKSQIVTVEAVKFVREQAAA